jgi:hypothetical protein
MSDETNANPSANEESTTSGDSGLDANSAPVANPPVGSANPFVDDVGLTQSQKAFSRGSLIWAGVAFFLLLLYFMFPANMLVVAVSGLGIPLFLILAGVFAMKARGHATARDALAGAVEYKLLVEILPWTATNQYSVTIVDQPNLPPLKNKKLLGKQPGLPGIMKILKNPSEASVYVDPKTQRVLAVVIPEGSLFTSI